MSASQASIEEMDTKLNILPGEQKKSIQSNQFVQKDAKDAKDAKEKAKKAEEKEAIKKQFEDFAKNEFHSFTDIFLLTNDTSQGKKMFIQIFEKLIVFKEILFYLVIEKDVNEYYVDYISDKIYTKYKDKYRKHLFIDKKGIINKKQLEQYIEELNALLLTHNLGNLITDRLCQPIIVFIDKHLFEFKPIKNFVATILKLLKNNNIQKIIDSLKEVKATKDNKNVRIGYLQIIILEMYDEFIKSDFYTKVQKLLKTFFEIQKKNLIELTKNKDTKVEKKTNKEQQKLEKIINDENDIFFKLLLIFNDYNIKNILKVIQVTDTLGTRGQTLFDIMTIHASEHTPFAFVAVPFLTLFFEDYNLLKLLETYYKEYHEKSKNNFNKQKEFYPYLHHLFCLLKTKTKTETKIDKNYNTINPVNSVNCETDIKQIVKKTLKEPFELFMSYTTTENNECKKFSMGRKKKPDSKYYGFFTSLHLIYYELFQNGTGNKFLKYLLPIDDIENNLLFFKKNIPDEFVKKICEDYNTKKEKNISVKILLTRKLKKCIQKKINHGKTLFDYFDKKINTFYKYTNDTKKELNKLNPSAIKLDKPFYQDGLEVSLKNIKKYFEENKLFSERIVELKEKKKDVFESLLENSEIDTEQIDDYIKLLDQLNEQFIEYFSKLKSLNSLLNSLKKETDDINQKLKNPNSNATINYDTLIEKIKDVETIIKDTKIITIIEGIEKEEGKIGELKGGLSLYTRYKNIIKVIFPHIWKLDDIQDELPDTDEKIFIPLINICKRIIKGRLLDLNIYPNVLNFFFKTVEKIKNFKIKKEAEKIKKK